MKDILKKKWCVVPILYGVAESTYNDYQYCPDI